MTDIPTPDPRDPVAVEYAAALFARSSVVRLAPGEIVTVSPRRFERQGIAYSVTRLKPEESEWLAAYQAAVRVKRREDREREREERRRRP